MANEALNYSRVHGSQKPRHFSAAGLFIIGKRTSMGLARLKHSDPHDTDATANVGSLVALALAAGIAFPLLDDVCRYSRFLNFEITLKDVAEHVLTRCCN